MMDLVLHYLPASMILKLERGSYESKQLRLQRRYTCFVGLRRRGETACSGSDILHGSGINHFWL